MVLSRATISGESPDAYTYRDISTKYIHGDFGQNDAGMIIINSGPKKGSFVCVSLGRCFFVCTRVCVFLLYIHILYRYTTLSCLNRYLYDIQFEHRIINTSLGLLTTTSD